MNDIYTIVLKHDGETTRYELGEPTNKDQALREFHQSMPNVRYFFSMQTGDTLYLNPKDFMEPGERRRPLPPPSQYVHPTYMGGRGNKRIEKLDEQRKDIKEKIERLQEEFDYPGTILGKYADRGHYEHLVGKRCRIVYEDDNLEVCLIRVPDNEKEWVVRKKDIQI